MPKKALKYSIIVSLSLSLSYNYETKKIKEICQVRAGRTPSTNVEECWCQHVTECNCINWYTQKDITQSFLVSERQITPHAAKECKMPLTTPNSILLTNVNEPVLFYSQKENITCNQQIFLLEPNLNLISPAFLYSYLTSSKEKLIRQFHRKQFFNSLTKNKLNDFEITLPPLEKQKELSEEIIQKERLEKSQRELINLFEKKKNQILNILL